jgi:hypothetical protein
MGLADRVLGLIEDALDLREVDLVPLSEVIETAEQVQFWWERSSALLYRRYLRAEISKAQLIEGLEARFRRGAIRSFLAGKRSQGPFGMTQADYAALDAELPRHMERLRNVPITQFTRRIPLYAARLRGFAQFGRVRAYADSRLPPNTPVWWTLRPAEHCDDCLQLADNSPYRVEELMAHALTPGSGHTICGNNCKCVLSFDVSSSPARPLDISLLSGFRTREVVL